MPAPKKPTAPSVDTSIYVHPSNSLPVGDLARLRGIEHAKRGLIVAATGNHPVLVFGPSGCGKTALIQAFLPVFRAALAFGPDETRSVVDECVNPPAPEDGPDHTYDLYVRIHEVGFKELFGLGDMWSTADAVAQVVNAVKFRAAHRREVSRDYIPEMREPARRLLSLAYDELQLTPLAAMNIVRVARTVADLAQAEHVGEEHMAEAILYRDLRRPRRPCTDKASVCHVDADTLKTFVGYGFGVGKLPKCQ
jgi:hypothetical protein